MPAKKPEENFTFQHKVKVLQKLFESGCKTEKALQSLTIENILKIPGITIPDMTVIMDLQRENKTHKLFSYLGGSKDEQQSSAE